MFNFTLTNLYNGYAINNFFMEYITSNRHMLKEDMISFNQIAGSFPFNTWNGGLNGNYDKIPLNKDISLLFTHAAPQCLRLNFANLHIEETDFENNFNRIILEYGANGSTIIEIANLKLYEWIKEKYPIYNKFVLSPNAWEVLDFTPEMLDVILDNPDFILATIPKKYAKELGYLSQIRNKSKIEIEVNPICPAICKNYSDCIENENLLQYEFSESSNFAVCNKCFPYHRNPQIVELEELKKMYFPLGINHFKLAETPYTKIQTYFIFLVKYFIKPEYQLQVFEDGFLALFGGR